MNNDKAISNSFNNRNDLFYVCESFTISDNTNAYKCCLYNMTTDQCDEIFPTTIPTTIPTTAIYGDIYRTHNLQENHKFFGSV